MIHEVSEMTQAERAEHMMNTVLVPGQQVTKVRGYFYEGQIVSTFTKKNGEFRFVVENTDGLLMIFNREQIALKQTHDCHVETDNMDHERVVCTCGWEQDQGDLANTPIDQLITIQEHHREGLI